MAQNKRILNVDKRRASEARARLSDDGVEMCERSFIADDFGRARARVTHHRRRLFLLRARAREVGQIRSGVVVAAAPLRCRLMRARLGESGARAVGALAAALIATAARRESPSLRRALARASVCV